MDKKYVLTGITSGVVCLVMGLLLGYIAGTNMIPGMQLSGADFGGPSVQRLGNGTFSFNGQTMDMDTLMMALQMERSSQLDGQMQEAMRKVEEKNALTREAQEHLDTLREYQYSGRTSAPEAAVVSFFDAQGIPYPSGDVDGNYSDQDWQDMSDSLQEFIAIRNNENQMDMIRLQSLMNKQQQTMEMMSNIMKKQQQTTGGIIQNMR